MSGLLLAALVSNLGEVCVGHAGEGGGERAHVTPFGVFLMRTVLRSCFTFGLRIVGL